jgi:hypothetical protein
MAGITPLGHTVAQVYRHRLKRCWPVLDPGGPGECPQRCARLRSPLQEALDETQRRCRPQPRRRCRFQGPERRAWCDAPASPHNALGFRGDIQNLHPENSIDFAVTASVHYAECESRLRESRRTGRSLSRLTRSTCRFNPGREAGSRRFARLGATDPTSTPRTERPQPPKNVTISSSWHDFA